MGTETTNPAETLRRQQERIGVALVPFGWSTPKERMDWAKEAWAEAADRPEAFRAWTDGHNVAYAYAIGWCDARFRIVDGRRTDGDRWDEAATLALAFSDEYARQEWCWVKRDPFANTKRGYALWWNEITRAYGLR